MHERLIDNPVVFPLASPSMDLDVLEHWIDHNNLKELVINKNSQSPLSKIYQGVMYSPDNSPEFISEFGGRHCYGSWAKGRETQEYLKNILEMSHGSVLEHINLNFIVQGVSRSLSLELVRHRAGTAISQESQRYVDAKDIKFVVPPIMKVLHKTPNEYEKACDEFYYSVCKPALDEYIKYQELFSQKINESMDVKEKTVLKKRANEAARSVLPNCAETKMLWSCNARALRHILELRGDSHADLEIRKFAVSLYRAAFPILPNLLYDFKITKDEFGETLASDHKKV